MYLKKNKEIHSIMVGNELFHACLEGKTNSQK